MISLGNPQPRHPRSPHHLSGGGKKEKQLEANGLCARALHRSKIFWFQGFVCPSRTFSGNPRVGPPPGRLGSGGEREEKQGCQWSPQKYPSSPRHTPYSITVSGGHDWPADAPGLGGGDSATLLALLMPRRVHTGASFFSGGRGGAVVVLRRPACRMHSAHAGAHLASGRTERLEFFLVRGQKLTIRV